MKGYKGDSIWGWRSQEGQVPGHQHLRADEVNTQASTSASASPPGRGGCEQWIVVRVRRRPFRALLAFYVGSSIRA